MHTKQCKITILVSVLRLRQAAYQRGMEWERLQEEMAMVEAASPWHGVESQEQRESEGYWVWVACRTQEPSRSGEVLLEVLVSN